MHDNGVETGSKTFENCSEFYNGAGQAITALDPNFAQFVVMKKVKQAKKPRKTV